VLLFQLFTKDLAWLISLFHCSTDQVPTPPSGPQKWPLKWMPISSPSSQAPRTWVRVFRIPSVSLKPMSELPALCLGGS
jgi:hypothetical protein